MPTEPFRSGRPDFPPLTSREAIEELLFFASCYMEECIEAAVNLYANNNQEDDDIADECIRHAEAIGYIFGFSEDVLDAMSIDFTAPETPEELFSSVASELLGETPPCPPPTSPSVSSATSPTTLSSPSPTLSS